MKRKRVVLFASLIVMIYGYTIGIFAKTDGDLTQKQMDAPNTMENQEDIAKSVLDSTGRMDQYDLQDLENITVYFGGDVTKGEQEDIVVTLNFGPKNTVVAAYASDGNVYEYVGDLGDFYGVQSVRFVPVAELGKDIVVVRERINESLGSFQQTDVLKGYSYNGEEFQDVLNTPQKIQSNWNNIWNQGDLQEESLWRRVTEETENIWEDGKDGDNSTLTVTRYQEYLESDDTEEGIVPEDDTYTQKDCRVVVEKFHWSDEWGRFILEEAVEKETGQPVAIIENLTASPYGLAGFTDHKDYLIVRKDGTTKYVTANDLELQP